MTHESDKPGLELPTLPPVIFGIPVLIGVLVHLFVWDGEIFGNVVGIVIGVPLTIVGLWLIYWTWRTMVAHGEHPEPGEPTHTLVTSGPFRRTRNPIYSGFLLIASGIAISLSAMAMLISVFFGVIALTLLVIRREEAYLEREFGETYTNYANNTRRWL